MDGVVNKKMIPKKNSDHYSPNDRDILNRAITCIGFCLRNFINNVHTFCNLPENRVLAVEEVVINKIDEELASPRIGAGICHRDRSPVIPVVVCEFVLDHVTWTAPAGASRVPSLNHKSIDDPMEDHAVIKAFFHECFKVACGNGHIWCECDGDVAHVRFEPYHFL